MTLLANHIIVMLYLVATDRYLGNKFLVLISFTLMLMIDSYLNYEAELDNNSREIEFECTSGGRSGC